MIEPDFIGIGSAPSDPAQMSQVKAVGGMVSAEFGGVVSNSRVTLEFPPGALNDDTYITMVMVDKSELIAALQAPREVVHNQTLNVGTDDENYRIRELAEMVAEVVPGSRVEFAANLVPAPRSYRVSFARIHSLLPEFRPQWDGRRGIAQLHAAFREHRLSFEEFEGPRYHRAAHLRELTARGNVDSTLRWVATAVCLAG